MLERVDEDCDRAIDLIVAGRHRGHQPQHIAVSANAPQLKDEAVALRAL